MKRAGAWGLLVTDLAADAAITVMAILHSVRSASVPATAASVLAAMALFAPLRRRVQRAVDRRFNRARYDAEAVIAAFARRMREPAAIDAVRADLAAAVTQTLDPAHASVWVRGEPATARRER